MPRPRLHRVRCSLTLPPAVKAGLAAAAADDGIDLSALVESLGRTYLARRQRAGATETVRPQALPPGGSLRATGEREGAHT